jgi:glycosyltransferase involved in cell wall biosynthesis
MEYQQVNMGYLIITPAKNEEKYIENILASVTSQSYLPKEWVIVDDGSTDNTVSIVESYIRKHNWIRLVQIRNHEEKKAFGSKVMKAFYKGYDSIEDTEFDFIVKLDADLTLPDNYFEEIVKAFKQSPKLGIAGGIIVEKESDFQAKLNSLPYVQGAIKSIRRECWFTIGGFVKENGWDGIDQMHAMYKGWEVKNLPLKVLHHRLETTEYRSLNFFYKNGRTTYLTGNDFFLTIIRCFVRLKEKPYVLAGFWFLVGWVISFLKREPKIVDKGLGKFIRNYHYNRVFSKG